MKVRWTLVAVGLLLLPAGLLANPADDAMAKFDHAEYMRPAADGQKKAGPAVKGTLAFDAQKKSVEFLSKKGEPAFDIQYDAIKSILYEKTSHPHYASAILISPLFLLSPGKKHFLTIQYTGDGGAQKFVIVQLDKKNAQEAVATAESQTGKQVQRSNEK